MERILYKKFTFSPDDARKNILIPFQTERDYDSLVIRLKYGPKTVRDPKIILPQIEECVKKYFPSGKQLTEEDMKDFSQLLNFVTLSLDRDGEYVGCAHRHPPEQTIVISNTVSSRGFDPVPVSAGDWRIVLHVQAVVVGTIGYCLEVYGLEGGERDDQLPAL